MAKFHLLEDEAHRNIHGVYQFYCPGCGHCHCVHTLTPDIQGVKWGFNGNVDKPTIFPRFWVNKYDPESRCHSFIKDGNISFLSDCYHLLKNITVEIPEWEDIEDNEDIKKEEEK